MTKEEAIKGLKKFSTMFTGYKPNEEMFAMAIEALEQEPCDDCISREAVMNILGDSINDDKDHRRAVVLLNNLPSVTPKQQTCDDAVSRQAVLDEINKVGVKGFETYNDYSQLYDFVDTLPSVTPKGKTEWIPVSERLPEEFESVLVCYKSQGGMAQAVSERFGTYTGYKWSALARIEPIAWMPLPKPYEPQESEDTDADSN